MRRNFTSIATLLCAGLFSGVLLLAEEPDKLAAGQSPAKETTEAGQSAINPKPLGETTQKGLAYLISQQHPNGGWGQGGGWRTGSQGRVEGAEVQDPPDVGNTAIATLALIRAGNSAREGKYSKNIAKAVEFIATKIDNVE